MIRLAIASAFTFAAATGQAAIFEMELTGSTTSFAATVGVPNGSGAYDVTTGPTYGAYNSDTGILSFSDVTENWTGVIPTGPVTTMPVG